MKLEKNNIKTEQAQIGESYEQPSLNQLRNNKWNKLALKLRSNWLLKIEFLFIILLLATAIYLLDVFGLKIYQVISKGTTVEKNVHLELAIIIDKNHEQYIYAKSLKDPFFLLKSGIFNVLSMTTDVFYATLKTSINENSIFIGNLPQLTRLLRIYQITIAIIFILVPFLMLLFFFHILKTLFRKIAMISKILVANNIEQDPNNRIDNLKHSQTTIIEKPKNKTVKKLKVKKPKNPISKAFMQNLDSPNQQSVLPSGNKQLSVKMDLENKKNNDTINSEKKKEKGQYDIGSIIYIDNVAYDIIKFQKQVQNGKPIKIALARSTKTGEIVNFPYEW